MPASWAASAAARASASEIAFMSTWLQSVPCVDAGQATFYRLGPGMTLRCPGCGAPSRTGDARCGLCQARLATIGCPACFALLFEGSAYCPHCGAAQQRGQPMEARQVRCPACRGAMRWMTVGDLDLLECEACDGTWAEADAFERLCANREKPGRGPARQSAGGQNPVTRSRRAIARVYAAGR